MTSAHWHQRRCAATLMELLVVIAIIAMIAGFSIPKLASISESSNLTAAGQILSDQIKLAAQTASSRNEIVEVRLIKATPSMGGSTAYSSLQIWNPDSTGTLRPMEKIVALPQGIVISENPGFSPLLTLPHISKGTLSGGAASASTYTAFKIHPSGFFEPAPDFASPSQLYLTLLGSRYSSAASLPPNYVTLQISPYTCGITIYRP